MRIMSSVSGVLVWLRLGWGSMTSEMIMLRPMRRTDFPALEELVRQAWYVDDERSER